MRIAVTGSIATDHLMSFSGSFSEQLVNKQLEKVSLSFLADSLEVRRGGVAANIAFGLGRLGPQPLLVGAAGSDFQDYRVWLKEHRVDTDWVRISDSAHTARFVCTTDREQNQIGTFYPGAMAEASTISIGRIAEQVGGLDMVMISPDDPAAMVRHSRECRFHDIMFAADPSQQLAILDRGDARQLLCGARFLFTNEYESELLTERTGWRRQDILDRVGTWVITRGGDGVRVERGNADPFDIPAVPIRKIAEPTGAGDAFRAGFLAGLTWRTGFRHAVQLGCAMAAAALGTTGTQTYPLTSRSLRTALRSGYGAAAADAIAPHLTEII